MSGPDRCDETKIPDVVTALGEVLDDAKAGKAVAVLVFAVDAKTRTAVYMGGRLVDQPLHTALILEMVDYLETYRTIIADKADEDENPN